jgi:polyhydroxybutyrate depolymerase
MLRYNVRTPPDYSPDQPYPLIVVYAGANRDAAKQEEKTDLTGPATSAGYLIAFADHGVPGEADEDLALIPELVAQDWCVDENRIYLTGHSDGGSVSYLILINGLAKVRPAAIAPSAAGLGSSRIPSQYCPKPAVPVMILHSSEDKLFPGFGLVMRDWLAACFSCPAPTTDGGCTVYAGCDGQVEVRYCEHDGKHGHWPDEYNETLIDFFDRFPGSSS